MRISDWSSDVCSSDLSGMKGVFAPVGSYVPGTDLTLKAGKIRGEESNGMLVSERELGLSDEHEGIIELSADTPLGAPFAEVMGRSEEHTSELQSLMRISYAVFCLKKKKT